MSKEEIMTLILESRENYKRKQQLSIMKNDFGFDPNDVNLCACLGPAPKVEKVDGVRLWGVSRCMCVIDQIGRDVQTLIDAGLIDEN